MLLSLEVLMTSYQIGEALSELVLSERRVTNEILTLINLAQHKRAYLELGYSSMFDWLVKGFGYSSSAAYRRITAARLIQSVPEASQKLSEGKVNLSTLSKAQSMIRQQENILGSKIDNLSKEEIVRNIENKSVEETERMMISLYPEIASDVSNERRTVINEDLIRHHINLSHEATSNLKRAKEVLSHQFPEGRDADVIAYALNLLLDKKDPLRRKTIAVKKSNMAAMEKVTQVGVVKSPAEKEPDSALPKEVEKSTAAAAVESDSVTNVYSKMAVKRLTFKRSEGACTYKDPISGNFCGSKYQAQLDHIVPRALGGSDHPSNLRVLCRQHNLLMAEKVFGKKLMNGYRSNL